LIYHWYRNGVILPEGESAPVVMFGGEFNMTPSNGLGGPNCRTVGTGTIELPIGGGAGVGWTNSLAFYECKSPNCEAQVKEKTGLQGLMTISSENNLRRPKNQRSRGGRTC
jgi:hypothetical protein